MIETLLAERERLWNSHPIIQESAILPTTSVQDTVGAVLCGSRRTRSSHALWADPLTGKSFCLDALEGYINSEYPNRGVLRYEPVRDESSAEGRLLEDILLQMDIAQRIARSLAGKRDQLHRALFSLAGMDMHLFILIDEAQEMGIQELIWLKAVINKLTRRKIKVSSVLIGQRELKDTADKVRNSGRSDLSERFFKRLIEFKGCCSLTDFTTIHEAIDTKSEFPIGSGWSYGQLLFPKAFAAGFTFRECARAVWSTLIEQLSAEEVSRGIRMDTIASYLANICILHRELDAPSMQFDIKLLKKSARDAFK